MKGIFVVFFLLAMGSAIGLLIFTSDNSSFELAFIVLGGVAVTVGCSIAFYRVTTPKVFDKHERLYWKGRKSPNEVFDKNKIKDLVEFDQIHALQIISEICKGKDSSFYSYELNFVLKEGKRINVIDHGDVENIRIEAETLSAFLEKPVWDAVHESG